MPSIRPFRDVKPGGQVSAAELNRAFAELERLVRSVVAPPMSFTTDGAGSRLRLPPPDSFWAELLDKSDAPGSGSGACSGSGAADRIRYAWKKVIDDGCGGVYDDPDGLQGTTDDLPAYEINGLDAPLDTGDHPTRVRMWRGALGTSFYFTFGGAETDTGSGSGPSNVWTVPVESCDQTTGIITTTTYRITFPRGTTVEVVPG